MQTDLLGNKSRVPCLVKQTERDGDRTRFEAVASSSAVDRDGEMIEVAGWEWKEPLPKLLYGHSTASVENILGKLEAISKEGDQLKITASINEAAGPAQRAAGVLVRSGDLDTLSVGFEPLAWVDADGTRTERKSGDSWPFPERGRRYVRQELLEVSLVGVPSNYEAVVTGIKALQQRSAGPEPNGAPLEEWEQQIIADFLKDLASTEWQVRLGLKFAEARAEKRAVRTMDAAHRMAALLRSLERLPSGQS